MSDVLPCPFCGQAPEVVPWHGGGPRKTSVHCDNDTCVATPGVIGPTRAGAIRRWNIRRDPLARAAPDLLKGCQDAVRLGMSDLEQLRASQRIKAAIKKATAAS
jgi:hypothetical protein